MKTYLYVDFYFILNFTMNLFLILITAMLRQKRGRFFRFVVLSGISAVCSVFITYFLWEHVILQMAISMLQMGGMVYLAYEKEGIRTWVGDFILFLFLTFFTGGLIGAVQGLLLRILEQGRAYSMVWIFLSVFFLFLLFFVFRFAFIRQEHSRKSIRKARIIHSGREFEIRVLYDTGNQLVSPYTGEGVAIIAKELAEKVGLEQNQRPILIPYHSIGGDGLLKAYRMEEMRLEGKVCKKNFLAAVSENLGEEQGVQMILNIT